MYAGTDVPSDLQAACWARPGFLGLPLVVVITCQQRSQDSPLCLFTGLTMLVNTANLMLA